MLISAGTDGFSPQADPWPALDREMELLQDGAGMKPADVLRSATLVGAMTMHLWNEAGTIEAGKLANLAFTSGDPLAGVKAFRTVVALTVKRGQDYWRKDYRPVTPAAESQGEGRNDGCATLSRRGRPCPPVRPDGGLMALAAPGVGRAARATGPLIINALGGLENPNLALARQGGGPADTDAPDVDARAIADARASGLTAVNITLGYVAGPEDPYAYTLKTITEWDAILTAHPDSLLKVDRAADILRAHDQGQVGVIYGFQNAAQIGTDPGRVDTFADLGVRVIQLTYNPANLLGDGSAAAENRGLTPLGREVVARLNARRIMVDLSHSGERTCLDAIAASKAPISINHTGCRALADLPRNKTDAELRGVAQKGGFVGIYFMPFLTLSGHSSAEDVVAHIEHAVNVCGEDHVGIGTDGSVTAIDDLAAYQTSLAREVAERAKAGIGAKGERADTWPFGVARRGPEQFRKLARLLAARGLFRAADRQDPGPQLPPLRPRGVGGVGRLS